MQSLKRIWPLNPSSPANTVIVLDFETTGLSPNQGDRAIEIGAVLLENGQATQRFQELMNPGFRVNSFIENYTGISNTMLRDAPPCEEVMERFYQFVGSHNLVAHNASFDQRFLEAEFAQIGRRLQGQFACSMLLSRRLFPDAPNHKLGSLVAYNDIENDGVFHRALADSEMTAKLWNCLLEQLANQYHLDQPSFSLMQQISSKSKANVASFLRKIA
ncbi:MULTISPECIES: 3'-5' exonuclease [unclassified Agarivorans]|uniref:3'-5' exonuclease n=1 Tax=unclassified Agarivorans TaxID=2636026 RepID=UPI0026E356AD|nr:MULTISPECIES: 3'-5' exonuclease [unclassified Agarivorans]MDO6684186.1 3'-5' exonuclease [Agarivorans sp. 3_MG-2023]MDO6714080.1 3'-5' exonuclease [Agarivorans sp. 2_MG-2023]